MRQIKKLFKKLENSTTPENFLKKYPQYNIEDNKIHLLYIHPYLNGTGFYRFIAPALELNKSTTHSAIIDKILKWDYLKQHDGQDIQISMRLVEWADYVIFPYMFQDLENMSGQNILKDMKEVNPDIQFVMDIDDNVWEIPKTHYQYSKYTKQGKEILLKNLSKMNLITAPVNSLLDYIEEMINFKYMESEVEYVSLPNLLSDSIIDDIKKIENNEKGKIKIGIISNGSHYGDMNAFKKVLIEINNKYKNKVEIIIFGWNGKNGISNALQGVSFTFEKPVNIFDYFRKLNNLKLDMALIPIADIPFNTAGKSPHKYLEYSAFAIPVIAKDLLPYNEVIIDSETGLLAKEKKNWIELIDMLINDEEKRIAIGETARADVWENYSFTKKNLELWTETFY